MSAPKFDAKTFHKRVSQLYEAWKNDKEDNCWNDADAIAIVYGNTNSDHVYRKSSILHLWLFGYELPDTILIACENTLYIYTSSRKIKFLETLKEGSSADTIPLEFIERTKKADENIESLKKLLESVHSSFNGKKLGILKRDKQEGSSVDQWKEAIASEEVVSISKGISKLLNVKDATEQKFIRRAASISSRALEKLLVARIEKIIDEEEKVKQSDIADEIEKLILSGKLTKETIDRCYSPIIQSGGSYDLSPTAMSTEEVLKFDTIICSLGIRYRNYCSNIARTLMINPTAAQKKAIEFLLELQQHCLRLLKPGAIIKDIYDAVIEYISEKRPDLVSNFVKNLGFGIGLEYRETSLLLSEKNKTEVKSGMAFNLILGFDKLELDENGKPDNYAVLLSDIVLVNDTGSELLTKLTATEFTYNLEDEAPTSSDLYAGTSAAVIEELAASNARQARATTIDTKAEEEEKRRQHQAELAKKQLDERIRRYNKDAAGGNSGTQDPVIQTDLKAYSSAKELPPGASIHRIFVDADREAIVLPIYGHHVPFHISTIKNVTKDNDYLRVNFLYPGTQANVHQLNHKAIEDAKTKAFIRELSFCIPDQNALSSYMHQMKQLLKVVKQREAMNDIKRSIVKQESLKLSKGSVPRLQQVFPRPSISGKTSGVLEAHRNGLRFFSAKRQKQPIDILYKNVRHAFFQPCDAREMIVALHFHLHDDIMVGRKKTKDIQFCMEATELSQSLSKSSRYGDPDEYEEERRERAMRKKYNKVFQTFAKEVEAQVNNAFEFDIPYKKLGFYGVPFKSLVFIQPTVNCLIQLIEAPFFVLSLQDIEICSLERVSFQLQQFDAIFVLNDFSKAVVRLDNIPMESLETLKKWLDSCNISYYESPENLMWKRIMKVINEDPQAFFAQGGWADMLAAPSEDEDEVADPDDDDFSEEDFAMDEDDDDSLEVLSEDEESGSSEEEDEIEDEPAADWDELEEVARNQDLKKKKKRQERGDDFSDDDEPQRKRRRV